MEPMPTNSQLWRIDQKAVISRVPAKDDLVFECICGNRMDPAYSYSKCKTCSERGHVKAIRVAKTSRPLLKTKKAVKGFEWFHSTINPEWINECQQKDAIVHIGEYRTALDILEILTCSLPCIMVYTVKLAPSATLSSHACPDIETGWPETTPELKSFIKEDVIRYVNCYEGPGSVSVLTSASNLVIVESHLASREYNRDMSRKTAIRLILRKINSEKKIGSAGEDSRIGRKINAMENLVKYLRANPKAYENRKLI